MSATNQNKNNMGLLHNKTVHLALRAVQGVFAIIVLGLAGYVAHWWNGYWNASSPSEINFLIFCAVWTLLVLIYFVLAGTTSGARVHHPYAVLGLDAITMIFWFAGFIAVAVFVHNRGCFGGVCRAAKAAAVFGAFEWLLFAITTAISALALRGHKAGPVATV
ncbi:uncharacterized protein RCC_04919 [Ramularia collo-cygni]|uniref:MARVEL domain-containing protein n=1 Tax=Ramularia collo-cygni TaxID=112498 RepID=A0A2D3VEN0_9PEZI|nr:uncharacterized protein RCC_04919 [Ramularia collo-cygni]CZT19073.1 uncharacterized protein RCC_04919 [Ramularia collo-cygni]